MKAVVFHGVGDIRVDEVPNPRIQEPSDAIVRLTASAICGTDLHFVRGTVSGIVPGTILGHEGVGVVEQLGDDVRNLIAIDGHDDRLEIARRQGAATINFNREDWQPGDGPSQVSRWGVAALAKAGSLAMIGVYPPTMNAFPIGQALNKNLTVNVGSTNHRKYIPQLIELVRTGAVIPSQLISQIADIEDAIEAYRAFDKRQSGWMKVELAPAS